MKSLFVVLFDNEFRKLEDSEPGSALSGVDIEIAKVTGQEILHVFDNLQDAEGFKKFVDSPDKKLKIVEFIAVAAKKDFN